jgi:hypothetical protein
MTGGAGSGGNAALLTADLRRRLPSLYATEGQADPKVQARFFTPWSDWTWYAIEFDGEELFFGLVDGFEAELGYFSLSELEALRGPGGIVIERDLHFEPAKLSTVKAGLDVKGFHKAVPFRPNVPDRPAKLPPGEGRSR